MDIRFRYFFVASKYVPENNILIDKASGKDLQRDGYLALKGALGQGEGDMLYIKSLD